MADAAPDPSSVRHPGPWQHMDVRGNGIRLHAAATGPSGPDAPLVVLVHGFAQYWWSWRHQLTALGDAGYRAVAVDMRGYGDSDKPPRGYDGWTLSGDIAGIVRGLGHDRATLVGHADGGLVCWASALLHPATVTAVATVAAPHPLALREAALRDSAQRAALAPSLLHDQLPRLAERRLTAHGGAGAERVLTSRAGAVWRTTDDFAETARRAREAIRIDAAAHCGLEYHRWALRSQLRPDGARFRTAMTRTPAVPVLEIGGTGDPYVLAATFRRCPRWAPERRLVTLPAGHYIHQERPGDTTAALLDFLPVPP